MGGGQFFCCWLLWKKGWWGYNFVGFIVLELIINSHQWATMNYNDFTVNAFMICNSVMFTTGSTDSRIHCWNTETGVKVAVMNADHPGPIQCLQFNPKYMMLASACSNMVQLYVLFCWLCIIFALLSSLFLESRFCDCGTLFILK